MNAVNYCIVIYISAGEKRKRRIKMGHCRQAGWIVVLLAAPAICISAPGESQARSAGMENGKAQGGSLAGNSTRKKVAAPACVVDGEKEITITCNYTAAPFSAAKELAGPRIVLHQLEISFEPKEESHMLVVMTLANEGKIRIQDEYMAYLAIDDDAGQNYVRRVLPHVELRKLVPGRRFTFSERLLVGSFQPGHYVIHLWIPNPDPSLKFKGAHNLLLSNKGTAEAATGLNTLATFTVAP